MNATGNAVFEATLTLFSKSLKTTMKGFSQQRCSSGPYQACSTAACSNAVYFNRLWLNEQPKRVEYFDQTYFLYVSHYLETCVMKNRVFFFSEMMMWRRRNHTRIFRWPILQTMLAIENVTSVKKKVFRLCDVIGNDLEGSSVVLHTELNASTSTD
jgi:hypothetical protein